MKFALTIRRYGTAIIEAPDLEAAIEKLDDCTNKDIDWDNDWEYVYADICDPEEQHSRVIE